MFIGYTEPYKMLYTVHQVLLTENILSRFSYDFVLASIMHDFVVIVIHTIYNESMEDTGNYLSK